MCNPSNMYRLESLVADELQHRITSEKSFTAFDVTKALRSANPRTDIPHWKVRMIVHSYMSDVVQCGRYEAALADFGYATAIQYQPMAHLSSPWLPLLPLN
jgi:hypothetical protein